MNQSQKKESLTKLLRVSFAELNYFIITDQITGKRFAVAEFGEPGSLSVKSNFMTFKEMECYLYGASAVTQGILANKNKKAIYWSTEDFEGVADRLFCELQQNHPKEFGHLKSWEQFYDKSKFPDALEKMISQHDANIGITWLTIEEHVGNCEIKN